MRVCGCSKRIRKNPKNYYTRASSTRRLQYRDIHALRGQAKQHRHSTSKTAIASYLTFAGYIYDRPYVRLAPSLLKPSASSLCSPGASLARDLPDTPSTAPRASGYLPVFQVGDSTLQYLAYSRPLLSTEKMLRGYRSQNPPYLPSLSRRRRTS